jgi:putative membrane protein
VHPLAVAAAVVAGLIHAWFFVLESVWFLRPRVWSRFGVRSQEDAEIVRSFAFNQGFYNLFLAVGIAIGLALVGTGSSDSGRPIVLFACGSMVAAGVVLVLHNASFLRAASIQAIPPLIAIVAALVLPR